MNAALFDPLVDHTRTHVQPRRGLVRRNHPSVRKASLAPYLTPVTRMPHKYSATGFNGDFGAFLHPVPLLTGTPPLRHARFVICKREACALVPTSKQLPPPLD